MSHYLQDFHKYRHVFGEFRASKADHRKAKGASKDLAATQAHQATISSYFMVTATQKANQASANREERQGLVTNILGHPIWKPPAVFNGDYRSLHKPLKEAYKWSNRVDATVQILDTHTRDHAFKMLKLNLYAWDKEVKFDYDIKALVVSMRKDTEGAVKNEDHPKLTGQQQVRNAPPEPLSVLATALQILHLVSRFEITYGSAVILEVTDRTWSRRRGNVRADWIWVRRRLRSWDSGGQLDGRTIARVEGLFKIWDRMQGTHEVAYVRLLRIKGSSRPHSKEGMIRMEKHEDDGAMQVIGISDIERMAHVILLEIDRVWLVNNRIDFNTWNKLYD
ncbi:hypothetical protein BGX38DRAFT_1270432 [Terfezia claveryi]|nr:hypothetical protein BGX38DRAFT_1270432 [Terfezia claveryi]